MRSAQGALARVLALAFIGLAGAAMAGENGMFTGTASRCVALTFDDGPDPVLTPRLLDILAEARVKATFYVIGRKAAQYPEIVQRAFREGHEIGNHSWSHAVLTQLSNNQVLAEVRKTDAAIQAATGTPPATIRAPYGSQSARIAQIVAPRPLVLWDTDTLDWLHRSSARVTRVADSTGPGTIVLMHDIHATTIAAAPALIQGLKERGVRLVTISSFLGGQCGGRAQPMVSWKGRHTRPIAAAEGMVQTDAAAETIAPKKNRWPTYDPATGQTIF